MLEIRFLIGVKAKDVSRSDRCLPQPMKGVNAFYGELENLHNLLLTKFKQQALK